MEPDPALLLNGTAFVPRDYFNEIHWQSKSWEVAHPDIFRQLISRRPKQWHRIPNGGTLQGLSYTLLNQRTPFGMATLWVCCEHPEMFDVPSAAIRHLEPLWDWWRRWGQSPILISCPIVKKYALTYRSWSIRSKEFTLVTPESYDDWEPTQFLHFLNKGCFTIASGQTLVMALHRASLIHSYLLIALFQEWRNHTSSLPSSPITDANAADMLWLINFNPVTIQMVQYVRTNTLVGDHLSLYAMYGNTSPLVLTYLLEQQTLLSPVFSILVEDPDTQELSCAMFMSYYSKLLSRPFSASASAWYSYWNLLQPYLPDMSLAVLRESPLYRQPARIYAPESGFYDNLLDIYLYLNDKTNWIGYVRFIQTEYAISDHRLVYYAFAATFRRRAQKGHLYAYWSFVRETFFITQDEWMRWVCRLMVYYSKHRDEAIPWRFFHWLFRNHPVFSVSLFTVYPVMFYNELFRRSLYYYLDLFSGHPFANAIPYLYKMHVLVPQIQGRLRVLYQMKRSLPTDIAQPLEQYLSRHQDLVWR